MKDLNPKLYDIGNNLQNMNVVMKVHRRVVNLRNMLQQLWNSYIAVHKLQQFQAAYILGNHVRLQYQSLLESLQN